MWSPSRIITQTVALAPGSHLGAYEGNAQICESRLGQLHRVRDTTVQPRCGAQSPARLVRERHLDRIAS